MGTSRSLTVLVLYLLDIDVLEAITIKLFFKLNRIKESITKDANFIFMEEFSLFYFKPIS